MKVAAVIKLFFICAIVAANSASADDPKFIELPKGKIATSRNLFTPVVIPGSDTSTFNGEGVRLVCGSVSGNVPFARVLGAKGDLLQLNFNQQQLYWDPAETRMLEGGGAFSCNDFQIEKNIAAITVGREHDMLILFGFDYATDGSIANVWKYTWQFRPEWIVPSVLYRLNGGKDVVVAEYLGLSKGIYFVRFCFDAAGHTWRRYHEDVAGKVPTSCDQNLDTIHVYPAN